MSSLVAYVFEASYEVDAFGRVADQIQAAHLGTLAAAQARDAVALSVAAATATGYITLRALDARLDILRDTLRSRSESLALARDRTRVGYTSDLEWRQAQGEYESTAQQVPQAEAAVARQEHALSLLVGDAPGPAPRGHPLAELVAPPVPDNLPSQLMRRRPDIAQAESALAASGASLRAARAQFLPSLNLTASLGKAFSHELPSSVSIWSIGAGVLAPILEGGRLEGQFDAAVARRDESAWAYRRTVINAFREVEDNLATLERLREQEAHVTAQREAVVEALRHATSRYDAGYAPYTDQLDAQRSLLSAQLLQAQARADELTTLVALYQAMGGGWEQKMSSSSAASR